MDRRGEHTHTARYHDGADATRLTALVRGRRGGRVTRVEPRILEGLRHPVDRLVRRRDRLALSKQQS
jgi:hypothetical protein